MAAQESVYDQLRGKSLSVDEHQDPDKHLIGDGLPVPNQPDIATAIGTTSSTGDSPIPARADHTHRIANNAVTSLMIANGTIVSGDIAADQIFSTVSIKHANVILADDAAAYIQFSGVQYGIFALSPNAAVAGIVLGWFRAGDTSGVVTIIASTGATVTGGSGTLSGTTGVDGNLNIRSRSDGVASRLHFENRTGAQRGYTITFLSLNNAADPPGPWVAI